MALHIRNMRTEQAVRRLARLTGKSLTATILDAVEQAYERERTAIPLAERLRPLQDKVAVLSGPAGLPADKQFYDDLSDGA